MAHYASQLSNALAERVSVRAFTGHGAVPLFTQGTAEGYTLSSSLRIGWRLQAALVRDIERFDPDVIHITNASYVDFFLYLRLRHRHIVTTVHDVRTHTGERSLANVVTNEFHKRWGDRWIVHGHAALRALGGDVKRVSVIPHGNYNFLFPEARPPTGAETDVLFFGRILPYKGLEHFIEAVRLAKSREPGISAIIAGRGDLGPYKAMLNRVEGITILNSFIPESDVPGLFSRAFVVVCPYVEGTQSGVIAAAYGAMRPVITTAVGDLPEAVREGETGFVVPPGSPEALAGAILAIWRAKGGRSEWGTRVHAFACDELGWGRIAEAHLAAYRRI